MHDGRSAKIASSARGLAAGLAVLLALPGCASSSRGTGTALPQSSDQHVRLQKELESERMLREQLERQHVRLQKRQRLLEQSVTQQTALGRDLEGKLARLHMLLLEKEAQVDELASRLEEAILEVVRAKAKLRSLESKAEAASNLAEAEIALKALQAKSAEAVQNRKYARAQELVKLGVNEFKNENFGGALYLSGQAKGLIREAQEQSMGRRNLPLLPGEVPFSIPVRLRTERDGDLRGEPTLASSVVSALRAGDPLVGHSYKGKWVRVQDGTGRMGWVFYDLVAAR